MVEDQLSENEIHRRKIVDFSQQLTELVATNKQLTFSKRPRLHETRLLELEQQFHFAFLSKL